jgi:hypothetical protein
VVDRAIDMFLSGDAAAPRLTLVGVAGRQRQVVAGIGIGLAV